MEKLTLFLIIAIYLLGCSASDPSDGEKKSDIKLYINEIMASNGSYPDNLTPSQYPDWVEIYNNEDQNIDLANYYICDDHYNSDSSNCYKIPSTNSDKTTINSKGYIVLYFDENPDAGELHTPFKLGGSGDDIYLLSPEGKLIDHIGYDETTGLDIDDISYGRETDGSDNWVLFGGDSQYLPTPNGSNGSINNSDVCDPNPCTENNKTVCTDDDGTAVCSCNQGYIEDENGDCIEDINNPCNPNPCTESNKTVCTDDDGTAVCSCDEGYLEDENGDCIENITNPCDPNPCTDGNKTVCTNDNGTAVCSCDIGYFENENGDCVENSVTYNLVINEYMVSNDSYPDDSDPAEYPDWVEIYNSGDETIDLAGFYLTDNHFVDGELEWHQIGDSDSDLTTIQPGEYIVFYFDDQPEKGVLHIGQKLGQEDEIYLLSPEGSIIDFVTYSSETGLDSDISSGRYPDGSDNWSLFGGEETYLPTPGYSNGSISDPCIPNPCEDIANSICDVENGEAVCICESGYIENENGDCIGEIKLYINEYMTSNDSYPDDSDPAEFSDWVEIYNGGVESVNLNNYYFCDDHFSTDGIDSCHRLDSEESDNLVVESGGFIVFYFDDNPDAGVLHIALKLGGSGDQIYLLNTDQEQIDFTSYEVGFDTDTSYGRSEDGSENWEQYGDGFSAMPTPGSSNNH